MRKVKLISPSFDCKINFEDVPLMNRVAVRLIGVYRCNIKIRCMDYHGGLWVVWIFTDDFFTMQSLLMSFRHELKYYGKDGII